MLELLKELVEFALQLGASLMNLVALVLGFAFDFLMILHTTMPRLEGLLVGVILAWLMMRRDKHPLIRALSSPLKLIIDILDLAWDQAVEFVQDIAGTAKSWLSKTWGWGWSKAKSVLGSVNRLLASLKDKLKK